MPKTVYKFILVQAILDLHRESCRNLIKNPNQKYFPRIWLTNPFDCYILCLSNSLIIKRFDGQKA